MNSQPFTALELANEVRLARAALKRALRRCANQRDAWRMLANLVDGEHPDAEGMVVSDLLLACRGTGTWRCTRLLRRLGLRPGVRIGELSERQRALLVGALRAGA